MLATVTIIGLLAFGIALRYKRQNELEDAKMYALEKSLLKHCHTNKGQAWEIES